jgi:hypothetical protein
MKTCLRQLKIENEEAVGHSPFAVSTFYCLKFGRQGRELKMKNEEWKKTKFGP